MRKEKEINSGLSVSGTRDLSHPKERGFGKLFPSLCSDESENHATRTTGRCCDNVYDFFH